MINREDMLELTRRMTSSRTHLARIAGAYIDEEGFVDGTFNTNFLNLKGDEKNHCLEIAKAVPFSSTNESLKEYKIPGMVPGSIWQLLYALRDCELKNDALLYTLYEFIADRYKKGSTYAIYVFFGIYDVPLKGKDKAALGESEEVYQYLIVTLAPTDSKLNVDIPTEGFLYPAFTDRSTDLEHVNVYAKGSDGLILKVLDL